MRKALIGLSALWRFMAPAQRRLLMASWVCMGCSALFAWVPPWASVVLGCVVLATMAYCLSIAKMVREELDEAMRIRGEEEMRRQRSDSA